jgi:hypothetical protein
MAQQAAHANEGAESYAQWRSEKAKGAARKPSEHSSSLKTSIRALLKNFNLLP